MKFKSDIEVEAGIKDSSGAIGTAGQVLSSTGSNVSWVTNSMIAERVQHRVKAGVAINKGQAVYVTGADGTNVIVGKASNASEATSSKTLGLIDATVAINGFANVVEIGGLAGLNTIGSTVGDPVWLGVDGNLIYGLANKPYAPQHLVFIGIVTRVNSNNGEIFINVQNGFELKEIHDVDIITNVPVNGDILGYDGTLWVNKTIAEWLGYVPADDALVVHKAGTETITGTKTFLDNITYFSNNGPYNIELSNPDDLTSILRIGAEAGTGNITSDGGLSINVGGTINAIGIAPNGNTFFSNTITAPAFKTYTGTASQFLKANGTVDSTVYVPTTRTITINGVTQSLAANQTWTVAGGIDGSGTANYISKFVDVDTIAISPIYDLNGNIGIGTITPTAYSNYINLSVGGSSRGLVSVRNNANAEVGYLYNQFGNVLTLESVLDNLKLTSATNKDIIFSTSGANERVRITAAGTTSISNNAALGTAGTNFIAYAYDSDSYFSLGNNTNDSLNLQLRRSNSDVMFSVDGHSGLTIIKGNTLIGAETDAGYKLDVNGTARFNGSIQVGQGNAGSGTPTQSIFQDTYGGNRDTIYVKNTADYSPGRGTGYGFLNGAGAQKGYIRWSADDASQLGYFITLGTTNSSGTLITPFTLASTGGAYFSSLAGSGTRFVTADANGLLSTTTDGAITSYNSTLTLNTSWQNTGIDSSVITTSGVYLVTCFANDFGVGGGQYSSTYVGTMYFYASGTNGVNANEIALHHSSHADNGRYIYLRTLGSLGADSKLYLQIKGNGTNTGNSTYVFTFKKLL